MKTCLYIHAFHNILNMFFFQKTYISHRGIPFVLSHLRAVGSAVVYIYVYAAQYSIQYGFQINDKFQ